MRFKDRMILTVLGIVFVITAGMFGYQNVYLNLKGPTDLVVVIVATTDIPTGAEFTPDNVGIVKMSKASILPQYVLSYEEIKGKSAKTDILKNDVISKNRVSGENVGSKLFSIDIMTKTMSNVEIGDNVRIFAQIFEKKKGKETGKVAMYSLYEAKQVNAVLRDEKKRISGLTVLVSDKEAIDYFNASQIGTILAVKYNDITERSSVTVTQFDVNSPELQEFFRLQALQTETDQGMVVDPNSSVTEIVVSPSPNPSDATTPAPSPSPSVAPEASPSETQSTNTPTQQKAAYLVKDKDTWESVAQAYKITADQLKKDNPEMIELTPGQIINVRY